MTGPFSPRLWSILLTVVVTLLVLDDFSSQIYVGFFAACIAPLAFFILVINYAVCVGNAIVMRTEEAVSARGGLWRWLVLPCALATVVAAMVDPWPMAVRFSLSREAFERKVDEVMATGEDQGGQLVGLYWVERIDLQKDGYVGFVTGVSLIDPVGFAYDPTHPPPSRPRHPYLGGNWYAVEW